MTQVSSSHATVAMGTTVVKHLTSLVRVIQRDGVPFYEFGTLGFDSVMYVPVADYDAALAEARALAETATA